MRRLGVVVEGVDRPSSAVEGEEEHLRLVEEEVVVEDHLSSVVEEGDRSSLVGGEGEGEHRSLGAVEEHHSSYVHYYEQGGVG